MATQEFMPGMGTEQDSETIADKYKKGPGTAPDISAMDIPQQQTKEERLEMVRRELPDLRDLVEYDRLSVEVDTLIMKQMENWVMLGKIPVNSLPESPFRNELQVRVNEAGVRAGKLPIQNEEHQSTIPGLQGLELLATHIQVIGFLKNYKDQFIESKLAQEEAESKIKESENSNG